MTTLPILYSPPADTAALEGLVRRERLPHRWSHGRAYVVIALLTPLVLSSVLLLHLHAISHQWLQTILLTLQGTTKND
ncbi:MAG TPA: hypothetical protein V6D29_01510 [Leptolyngbyaceae cyanobacterium]